jgi:ubiquinone/menaquinone biosynthesis C-methylase UbiE
VAEVTVGGHFERVAAVYDSLRTTDEAPVRRIGQFLPDRPVTGLDIGCGTGRYTRLLRALLPEGSLLVASDVSAAMLAQLKAGDCGHAREVVPLLAAAEQLPLRTASLDLVTAFNCVHHFDLGRFLAAVARVLTPGGQLFIYTRTPQQNARTVWGRYFPGFTEHEQRLHSKAAFRDAVRRTGGLTVVATQTFSHPRSSTAERLQAQAEGRHYSTFSLYTPEELRASTAAFLARLPRPEVCWADEHLLVVAGGSRNQVEPDGPGSLASQAIKDQALQITAGRAGQAPQRRPGGRAQITPLYAQSIAGDDLRHSTQIGGYFVRPVIASRVLPVVVGVRSPAAALGKIAGSRGHAEGRERLPPGSVTLGRNARDTGRTADVQTSMRQARRACLVKLGWRLQEIASAGIPVRVRRRRLAGSGPSG